MYVVNTKEVNMSWLVSQLVNVSPVGKALHWNHSSQGFSSCSRLNFFFLALFSLLLLVIVWRISYYIKIFIYWYNHSADCGDTHAQIARG